MNVNSSDNFYQFCKLMRDGKPVNVSLVRAYGMPYNRVQALEYVWRHDVETGKITDG
jgi:hypothetical protein